MNEYERREWLETLVPSQLRALCHVAGLFAVTANWTRAKIIDNLCLVEGIETPKETS